jgi:sugar/nucleoside kinase (ribokinase family)
MTHAEDMLSVSHSSPEAGRAAPVVCAGLVVADHVCPPLDHLPRPGGLVTVPDLILNIGGGAANTAVDLARLGVSATVRARVGDDAFGRFATEFLRGHGVDCSALVTDPALPTSQTMILNVRREDRRFIHSVGANAGFVASDLDAVLVPPPRVLHIGYFLILPQLDPHELADRFRQARNAGTVTLLDVATPGPGRYLDRLKIVLPHTDVFVPNSDEADFILGAGDPLRHAREFHEMGASRVVITRGDRGVVSVSDALKVKVGAYPTPYVDGSGGGDAFNAGYIVGILDGRPEIECLKLASAVGASCVRAVGTTAGVFTRAEADAFMACHEVAVEAIA